MDIKWNHGKVTSATITSTLGGNLRLRSAVPLKGVKKAKGENTNALYGVPQRVKQKINYPEALCPWTLPEKTYLYDIPTKRGQTITINAK